MYTGIIDQLGTITDVEYLDGSVQLTIDAGEFATNFETGGSIAVNGCSLTVLEKEGARFQCLVMEDTVEVTNLGDLHPGDQVNLEVPLNLSTPVGGHIMQGFIDGTTELLKRTSTPHFDTLRFRRPAALQKYFVLKGPVAIDGVSLTISALEDDYFDVFIIPMTVEKTMFKALEVGGKVNLEVDVVAKYVESMVASRDGAAAREKSA